MAFRFLSRFLIALAVLFVVSGCEETVPPTLDTGRPFTLWGTLDPSTERQAIRVVPIQLQIDANQADTLDATVVSTNLDTGEEVVWADTLVQFESGRAGFVVLAPFRPGYGERYEITARRSDGSVSTVLVAVPPLVEPLRLLPDISQNRADQRVLWPDAPHLNSTEVTLFVRNASCGVDRVEVDGQRYAENTEFGAQVLLPYRLLFEELSGRFETRALSLARIDIHTLVTTADWEPPFGFGFDEDIVIQPGTVSNVDNGFGFVGASYSSEISWIPEDEALEAAGFRTQASLCGP